MKKKRYYHNGRRVSKGEKRVAQYLDKMNISYFQEYTFKECISENGYPLRFDFYLNELNVLIEFNGQHHYKPVNKYRRAKRVHESTVIHDQIKKDFTDNHKIKLITIPYKDYERVEEILNLVLGVES